MREIGTRRASSKSEGEEWPWPRSPEGKPLPRRASREGLSIAKSGGRLEAEDVFETVEAAEEGAGHGELGWGAGGVEGGEVATGCELSAAQCSAWWSVNQNPPKFFHKSPSSAMTDPLRR